MCEETKLRVCNVMGIVFGIEPNGIPSDASQHNFPGWDSLNHMSLILALEDEFGVEFTDEEIVGLNSLTTLIKSVSGKCS
jgi:acyl carrier protein